MKCQTHDRHSNQGSGRPQEGVALGLGPLRTQSVVWVWGEQAAAQSLNKEISNISPLGALGSPAVCGALQAQVLGPLLAPFHPHSIKSLAGTSYTPWGQGSYRSCPGFLPSAPSITLTFPHWFCISHQLPGGESERLHFFFTSDRNCSVSSSPWHSHRWQGQRLSSKGHAVCCVLCPQRLHL